MKPEGIGRRSWAAVLAVCVVLSVHMFVPRAALSRVRWKMPSYISSNMPVLGSMGKRLAEEITRRSRGEIRVEFFEPGALVTPREQFEAVAKGKVDAAWSTGLYLYDVNSVFSLIAGAPFAMPPQEHYAWVREGAARTLYDGLYSRHHVKAIPAGIAGPEGAGWFRKPISGPSDLRGLRIRCSGMGRKLYELLGASPMGVPGGEVYPALERGVLDAAEFSTPYVDAQMRFWQVAKYYYYPSWHQPVTLFDLLVNRERWDALSESQKRLVAEVCHQNVMMSMEEDERLTGPALEEFRRNGVVVRDVPERIVAAAERAWQERVRIESEENPLFGRVYASYTRRQPQLAEPERQPEPEPEPRERPKRPPVALDDRGPAITVPDQIQTDGAVIEITGSVQDESEVVEVTLDGKPIPIFPDGTFQVRRAVPAGTTRIHLVALDEWGNEGEAVITVIRKSVASVAEEPPKKEDTGPSTEPGSAPAAPKPDFGRYYALVIGIDQYRHLTKLATAVADAKTVAATLRDEYGFQVTELLDPMRSEIISALDSARASLTDTDNLLVYYAGHGHHDPDSDRGYWLPVDAEPDRRSNWVSNATITDTLKAIRAKHVLVVADSCYAGTLTRGVSVTLRSPDYFQRMAEKRSRTVLTSGGNEPVADSGGGEHSVFADAFLAALQENSGVTDTTALFSTLRRRVVLNAPQTPQYSDIRFAGHEGGDFLFVRKK